MFISLSNQICTQFYQIVKHFQCDNGEEYDNTSFRNYCASNGLIFCSLSLTLHHKVARRSEKYALLTT